MTRTGLSGFKPQEHRDPHAFSVTSMIVHFDIQRLRLCNEFMNTRGLLVFVWRLTLVVVETTVADVTDV